jgi:hypothetical protein
VWATRQAEFNGGSTNLYSYAGNTPTNLRDPSGQNPACLVGGLLGTMAYNSYVIYQSAAGRKANYYAGLSGAGHILSGNAIAFGAGCALFSGGQALLQAGLAVPESTGALYAGGNGAALEAATNSGLNIMADTPVGSLANNVVPNSWTPVWDYLSSLYAEGLTGEVTVYQGEMSASQYANSIMINTELPIVQGNFGTTVTNIVMGAVP